MPWPPHVRAAAERLPHSTPCTDGEGEPLHVCACSELGGECRWRRDGGTSRFVRSVLRTLRSAAELRIFMESRKVEMEEPGSDEELGGGWRCCSCCSGS